MNLKTGQSFHWEQISEREFRVVVESATPRGPRAMLGYGRKFGALRPTSEWMKELREGEETP